MNILDTKSISIALAALFITSFVLFLSVFTLHQTNQIIIVQFGQPKTIIRDAGLHFKIPFIQQTVTIDKRILSFDIPPEEVITSDQKRIIVDAFVRFQIIDPLAFYKAVGNINVAKFRLHSLLNSSMRKVLGLEQFKNILLDQRAELMQKISNEVNSSAKDMGIKIVDTRIKRVDLPEANSQAIYYRMQTERQREAKEIRAEGKEIGQSIIAQADKQVQKIITDAEEKSTLLKGRADAESSRILNAVTKNNPDLYLLLLSLDKYEQAIGSNSTLIISPEKSDFFKNFNINR